MRLNKHLNPDGSQHVFESGVNLAIILDVKNHSNIYKAVLERRSLFGLTHHSYEPHLTLHMINFNYNHPYITKFNIIEKMEHYSKYCYRQFLINQRLKLSGFGLLGKSDDPTYVVKYNLFNKNAITKFRLCLYNKIARLIGLKDHSYFKGKLTYTLEDGKKAFIYSTPNGMPLYAIHEHYYGKNMWEPHISLFKLTEKSHLSRKELGEIYFKTTDYTKINRNRVINLRPLNGNPKLKFKDTSLDTHSFNKIKISTIGAVNSVKSTSVGGNNMKSKKKTIKKTIRKKSLKKFNKL